MQDWVTEVVRSMGYAGVALLMFLENVFPPIPSEVVMPLSGYSAARGQLDLGLVILVGTAATIAGTIPWYGLARWLERERVYEWVDRHGHWLTVRRQELERAERWFGRHGWWMVAVGRVVPGVRTLISIPAGFCGMPLGRYLLLSAAGSLVWTGALAYAGSLLGKHYDRIGAYIGPVTWAIFAAVFVVYVVRLTRMRREARARAFERAS